jgi:hypothetical protein
MKAFLNFGLVPFCHALQLGLAVLKKSFGLGVYVAVGFHR